MMKLDEFETHQLKLMASQMKQAGLIKEMECPCCGNTIFFMDDQYANRSTTHLMHLMGTSLPAERFYTLGGSDHHCKGMRESQK